jgi:hypothetical protein
VAGFRHSLALVLVGLTGLALTAAGVWGALAHAAEGWTTNRPSSLSALNCGVEVL